MTASEREKITLGERIATAFISAITAALTILAYFVITFTLAAAKSTTAPGLVSSFFFTKFSAYMVVTATVVGFLVGSDRMARLFSFCWGTHEIWEREWFQKLWAAFVIVVAVAIVTHLLHSSHAQS